MITVLGDIGNKAFALPMVQAYPTDVDAQQLLAWNPTEQALDYIPYTGNSSGDFGVTRDLTVGRDLTVADDVSVLGDFAVVGPATIPSIVGSVGIAGALNVGTTYAVAGTLVVGSRKTGWAAATGTATRTTFATGSVTLPQLAERVKALLDDLTTHGLIGA